LEDFNWVLTEDGSPTLKPKALMSEWMHSKAGAWNETQYVYGYLLDRAFEQSCAKIHLGVMGLGLGYIELLALKKSLEKNIPIKITSFEIENPLKEFFLNETLNSRGPVAEYFCGEQDKVIWQEVFDLARSLIQKNEFKLKENIFSEDLTAFEFHVLAYDAYSSQTQKNLWSEDFLKKLISTLKNPEHFYLATYAASSNLKRAAESEGLKLERRPGFANKRESFYFEYED